MRWPHRDHRPPFEHSWEIYAASGCLTESTGDRLPEARKIPLLIWSNFASKGPDIVCSANFLATELFSRIGIAPSGFLALNDALRRQLRVLSPNCIQTQDGRLLSVEALPNAAAHLLEDYRVLEYDLLLGKQYGLHSLWKLSEPQ